MMIAAQIPGRRARRSLLAVLCSMLVVLAGCGDDEDDGNPPRTSPDVAVDVPDDAERVDTPTDVPDDGPRDSAGDVADGSLDVADEDDAADVGEPMRLPREQPDSLMLGTRRGLRVARAIVHSHTVHSHDACDGQPRLDADAWNEPCLDDYRWALCANRLDVVFNTDHEELAAREPIVELLLVRPGDTVVMEGDEPVANLVACDNGHRPLLLPGGEFELMPVGMKRHIPGTVAEREDLYNEDTEEVAQLLRETGAVVLQAHVESKDIDRLRPLGLDGLEIYNLHANIGPDIREEFLGLDAFSWIQDIGPFTSPGGPDPELAFLGFYLPNVPSLATFDTLVSEGQHLAGVGGTDSHQNVLPLAIHDGERVDSFRRMMRWFSNHLLVAEVTADSAREALQLGRNYLAFEILGAPVGFDMRAETAEGDVVELGGTVSIAESATIVVEPPTLLASQGETGPRRVRLLRAAAGGAVEVASSSPEEPTLSFLPSEPGAYRAEVLVTPTHLRPYLAGVEDLSSREYVWIYAGPIYVE